MYALRFELRTLVQIRQSFSYLSAARGYYSTSTRRLAEAKTMFKKAVKGHSAEGSSEKAALQPSLFSSKENSQSSSSVGVKRKFEMSGAGDSKLGSLHSAVYFDENDFDDDDQLNFEEPDPFIARETASVTPNNANGGNNGLTMQSFASDKTADVKYPDLPPIPDEETSSSSFLPWSSSPISHLLPPAPEPAPKRRILPWERQEQQNVADPTTYPKGEPRKKPSVATTPAQPNKTTTLPWNKTASAVKQEQKEHRRQSKKPQESKQHEPHGRVANIFLSDEQRAVLEAAVNHGKSIFFTGSAGTGKSVLMRAIIKALNAKYRTEKDRVAVTASTGLAACNIEGMTLHSFAGIGLGKEDAPELVKKVIITPFSLEQKDV